MIPSMGRIHAIAALVGALHVATQAAGADEPVCTCRAPGSLRVELGGTTCLATPAGPRLARCTMDVNILSWQILDAPCTVSLGPPTPRQRLAALTTARSERPRTSPLL